jgi:hypothetical protein
VQAQIAEAGLNASGIAQTVLAALNRDADRNWRVLASLPAE